MATLRSSAPESLNIPEQMLQQGEKDDVHLGEISDYELCREERIRENRERMQKLGIFDLSHKLSALKPTTNRASRRKAPRLHSPPPPSSPGPVRRSSRLQSSTPVSYCELRVDKKDKLSKGSIILREEGSRPEVYTEEHEKLLGSTEMSWTLFVDGYGKDGKRIYDPVKGKTCHQCRQKTLGHRTHCSECNMVQGQFCGDCLYMRYGENVLEAKANPDWICPVCRGICNCSLCRQAKGWPPTGMLYKKIASLGYKSAAHYLIQTRRANTEKENNAGSKVPVSAKRSLPFSDIEVTGEEDDLPKPSCEQYPDPAPVSDKESGDGKLAHESGAEPSVNQADAALTKDEAEYPLKPEPEALESGDANEIKNENYVLDNKDVAAETSPKSTRKRVHCEPTADSISGRLRMRRNKGTTSEELQLVIANHTTETSPKSTRKRVRCEPTPESIAGRLRMRRNKGNTSEELQLVIANDTTGIAEVESIARRLRKRA